MSDPADFSANKAENRSRMERTMPAPFRPHSASKAPRSPWSMNRSGSPSCITGRKIRCPMLCMWSKQDDLEAPYGDVLGVWAPWAGDLQGGALDCGHHMAEEKPVELAARLLKFLLC